jgi:dTDP-4-amino-4,6-dideoxygalactose transaminase
MKIPLSRPDVGEAEISSIVDVLRSGRLSIGPKVEEFERMLADYTGVKYAVAVNSGTSARRPSVLWLQPIAFCMRARIRYSSTSTLFP